MINSLLSADADAVCGAEYGVASPDRVTQRDGYAAVSRLPDLRHDVCSRQKRATMTIARRVCVVPLAVEDLEAIEESLAVLSDADPMRFSFCQWRVDSLPKERRCRRSLTDRRGR